MNKLSKSLTKRKPRAYGSIKQIGITEMEKIEYRQTGMIRVKETPVSVGELNRLNSYRSVSYYEYIDPGYKWYDGLELF